MLVACQVLFIVQHLGWRFGERRELVGSQFDHLARALQPCLVRGRHAGPEARAADRADLTVELGTRDHAADDVLACWQEVCHRSDGESSAQRAIAVPLSPAQRLPHTDLLQRMVGKFFLIHGSFRPPASALTVVCPTTLRSRVPYCACACTVQLERYAVRVT